MSEKHVPTTETIKSAHRYYRTGRTFVPDEWSQPDYKIVVAQDEAFERWLDQVKADAWDEVADNLGEYAEVDDSLIHLADNIRDGNPYREQEEA